MDWENCIADAEKILPVHFTPGRTAPIKGIVLHHNAGNLTIEDCYRVWQTREASAHYQVEGDGRIGQLVNDWDTAWHAGDANPWSIGIEHANDGSDPWTVSQETLDAGAHLVAALCRKYGLGSPEWGVNVFGHSDFMATACPGELAGSQRDEYMRRAREWYEGTASDEMAEPPKSRIRYRAFTEASGWLDEMIDRTDTGGSGDDYAGDGSPILYLAMDFPGWYQVRTPRQGWLPKVFKYDCEDFMEGCAGDGSGITGVRCSHDGETVEYAVADVGCGFLPPMRNLEDTDGSGDDFAGDGGVISAVYARVL